MRIFLDANILFSASHVESDLGSAMLLAARDHTLVTSSYAREEAIRNIGRKRPQWIAGLRALLSHVELVTADRLALEVELVEKDQPILAAAILADCQFLVTGDRRHFGHLYDKTIGGVVVVSVSALFQRLTNPPPE